MLPELRLSKLLYCNEIKVHLLVTCPHCNRCLSAHYQFGSIWLEKIKIRMIESCFLFSNNTAPAPLKEPIISPESPNYQCFAVTQSSRVGMCSKGSFYFLHLQTIPGPCFLCDYSLFQIAGHCINCVVNMQIRKSIPCR